MTSTKSVLNCSCAIDRDYPTINFDLLMTSSSYFEISTQIKHFQHFVCDPLMPFVRLRSCGWKSAAPKSILTRKRLLKSALICWYTKVFGFKTSTPLQPFRFRLYTTWRSFDSIFWLRRLIGTNLCHTSLNRGTFFLYSIMHWESKIFTSWL